MPDMSTQGNRKRGRERESRERKNAEMNFPSERVSERETGQPA